MDATTTARGIARIRHVTFDCRGPFALAQFWGQVLGFTEDPENPNAPDDPEALIIDPTGHHPGLLFIPVPEEKITKNRIHLDLQPHAARDVAVERVVALGGAVVDDRRQADGTGWVVMADPEGNELCVERSVGERDDVTSPVDTGERAMPPEIRIGDERAALTGMLDWYREGVLAKVAGVRAHHAAATPLRSSTSIAGLLKHLALVEDFWFTVDFAGRPVPEPWAGVDWDADPDWEFHSAVAEPLDHLTSLYERACERSRAITDAHQLDEIGANTTTKAPFTLRYVLVHLIEETARHLGHLDVLREHLDGATGE